MLVPLHITTQVSMCVQKYQKECQAPLASDQSDLDEPAADATNAESAEAKQQAKADAKKAKKQRQKAKKHMTRTQAEALTPCTSQAETLAHSPEGEFTKLPSSEAQSKSAIVEESPGGEDNAGSPGREDTTASQHSREADLLEIFRCPMSKVSKQYASYMHTPHCTAT